MEGAAYSDMMESVGSDVTKRVYRGGLAAFMGAVPDGVFEKYAGARPKSRGLEDACEAFVGPARPNPDAAKAAVRSYVKGLKDLVVGGSLSPDTVPNKTKPAKALLAAAEIGISWKAIDRTMPPPVKSRERAYTREELRAMLAGSQSLYSEPSFFTARACAVRSWRRGRLTGRPGAGLALRSGAVGYASAGVGALSGA